MDLNPYAPGTIAEQPVETRTEFVRKTYQHLAGAIVVFAVLETLMIKAGLGYYALQLLGATPYSWLMVLGGFMLVGWIGSRVAHSATTPAAQYAGLALYVVLNALVFLPIIALAILYTGSAVILGQAAVLTGALVLGITAVAFTTRKDFSFLGGFLKIGGLIALGMIVASFFLPISLGLWFSAAMVVFASIAILYDTSKIMYHYAPGQHVAASLSLFASVALLFWYILRILMALTGRE